MPFMHAMYRLYTFAFEVLLPVCVSEHTCSIGYIWAKCKCSYEFWQFTEPGSSIVSQGLWVKKFNWGPPCKDHPYISKQLYALIKCCHKIDWMSDNAFSGDKPKNQYPIYGSKREVKSGDQPQDRYFCKRQCFFTRYLNCLWLWTMFFPKDSQRDPIISLLAISNRNAPASYRIFSTETFLLEKKHFWHDNWNVLDYGLWVIIH